MIQERGAHLQCDFEACNQNARAFASGKAEELVFNGQLIAWRVDGEVYMMLGDTDTTGVTGELNYMLSCLTEEGQADNRRFFRGKGGFEYIRGGDLGAPPVGPHEIIRVQQQEGKI